MENASAEEEFLDAVRCGAPHIVLAPGVSVNCKDASGNTALHIACYEDLPLIARFLLRLGANVAAVGSKGYTPLHAAAQVGSAPLVQLLLGSLSIEGSRNVKGLVNSNGQSALHVAAFNGHTNIVTCLVAEHCWDPNVRDSNERTCLHLACLGGHVDIVKLLVTKRHPLTQRQYSATRSLQLQTSIEYVSAEIFKCDVYSVDSFGKMPVHYACEQGHVDVVRVLHEYGVDISTCDRSGNACLHLAASYGHRAVLNVLLGECGADKNSKGYGEEAVLHSACRNGHSEVVRDLISIHQCDPSVRDVNSHTPLHVAAKFGRDEAVRELIGVCPVDKLDANGNTPLHLACEEGHMDAIRVLMEGGSSTEACNAWGITPLQAAALNSRHNAVEILVSEYGCDRSTIDPLHLLLKAEANDCGTSDTRNPLSRESVIKVFGHTAIIDG